MMDAITVLIVIGVPVLIAAIFFTPQIVSLLPQRQPRPLDWAAQRRADRKLWMEVQREAMAAWEARCACPEKIAVTQQSPFEAWLTEQYPWLPIRPTPGHPHLEHWRNAALEYDRMRRISLDFERVGDR